MVSLKIPPMINLCCLLLKNSVFEQEKTEGCGREGLTRLAFRCFDLLCLPLVLITNNN